MKNAESDIVAELISLTCVLNILAENVSGMKKNASSVNLVTLSASAIPLLLSIMDMFAIKDLQDFVVRYRKA